MKDGDNVKIVKIIAGCFLSLLYVVTGIDGVMLLLIAFLFGIPIEEFVKKKLED